jgi:hypothetical protein
LEAVLDAEIAFDESNRSSDDDDDYSDEDLDDDTLSTEELGNQNQSSDSDSDKHNNIVDHQQLPVIESEASSCGAKRKDHNIGSASKRPRLNSKETKTTNSNETSSRPDNFSTVDQSLSADQMEIAFPLFAALKRRNVARTVVLKAGQMLYLPAGWFHEVESCNSNASMSDNPTQGSSLYENGSKNTGSAAESGHMAFNYWFHPPDTQQYEKPYSTDFWLQVFELQKQAITRSNTHSTEPNVA